MSYAIIGFGAIGQALAKAFAHKGIEVSRRNHPRPEELRVRGSGHRAEGHSQDAG